MTTAAPAAETRPVTFAGIGEILVPDMRHREIFILGARLGDTFTVERAFHLEGFVPESLVSALLEGPRSSLKLVELDDLTGVVPRETFDLPEGSGPGVAVYGFEQAVRGFGSVLERVAAAQNAFHLLPRLFDRLWRQIGGGAVVRHHGFRVYDGERGMVASGDAWKRASPAAVAVLSEDKVGARRQLFGDRVLHGDLGVCPECGAAMVKAEDGRKVCELSLLKSQIVASAASVASMPWITEGLAAQLADVEIDPAVMEPSWGDDDEEG